jgi:hypothetical protein
MANITIAQVDARIKEIVSSVNSMNKNISDLNTEYQQLLGYKQAMVDMSDSTKNVQEESEQLLQEAKGA